MEPDILATNLQILLGTVRTLPSIQSVNVKRVSYKMEIYVLKVSCYFSGDLSHGNQLVSFKHIRALTWCSIYLISFVRPGRFISTVQVKGVFRT